MADLNKAEIGSRIKELRGGVTQKDFADLLGISRVSIVRYETGERTPDAEFLLKIQQVLNADIVYLLSGVRIDNAALKESSLTPREAALLDNYRNVQDEGDKKSIERMALLAATADDETATKRKRA